MVYGVWKQLPSGCWLQMSIESVHVKLVTLYMLDIYMSEIMPTKLTTCEVPVFPPFFSTYRIIVINKNILLLFCRWCTFTNLTWIMNLGLSAWDNMEAKS